MNKTVNRIMCILFVAFAVALLIVFIDHWKRNMAPDSEPTEEDNITISVDDLVTDELPEEQIAVQHEVTIDYTDIHKMLFEYPESELILGQLTDDVNYTLSQESITTMVESDVLQPYFDEVKSNSDNGVVYLVIRVPADVDSTQCYIDVCPYADRTAPTLSIKLELSDGEWFASKE